MTLGPIERTLGWTLTITCMLLCLFGLIAMTADHTIKRYYLDSTTSGVIEIVADINWSVNPSVYRTTDPNEALAFVKAANESLK